MQLTIFVDIDEVFRLRQLVPATSPASQAIGRLSACGSTGIRAVETWQSNAMTAKHAIYLVMQNRAVQARLIKFTGPSD